MLSKQVADKTKDDKIKINLKNSMHGFKISPILYIV
jgi:hypothetical protein